MKVSKISYPKKIRRAYPIKSFTLFAQNGDKRKLTPYNYPKKTYGMNKSQYKSLMKYVDEPGEKIIYYNPKDNESFYKNYTFQNYIKPADLNKYRTYAKKTKRKNDQLFKVMMTENKPTKKTTKKKTTNKNVAPIIQMTPPIIPIAQMITPDLIDKKIPVVSTKKQKYINYVYKKQKKGEEPKSFNDWGKIRNRLIKARKKSNKLPKPKAFIPPPPIPKPIQFSPQEISPEMVNKIMVIPKPPPPLPARFISPQEISPEIINP